MLTQVKSFFCLANSAQELGIYFALKSGSSFFQKVYGSFDIRKLATHTDCDQGVLERSELCIERLDHFVVKLDQVLVFNLIES